LHKPLLTTLLVACALLCCSERSKALPIFAHRFGLQCEVCHTAIPHLTPFGQAFLADGFRLPSPSRAAFPIALKVNLAYSSATDPSGLPKAIVDEVDLLAGAPVGERLSYRLEQYIVDGGVPGKTRDAWLSYTTRPDFGDSASALRVTAGEFTLPLPVDPETQRDTQNHYAVFDQTIGANPFDLFEDKFGIDAAYGPSFGASGTDLHVLALAGHDTLSGLASYGTDTMVYAQTGSPLAFVSAYRYEGVRPLGLVADHFYREGAGLSVNSGKATIDALVQHGDDSSADGRGNDVTSGGGYLQLHWTPSPAMFGVVRYDAAFDASARATHSLTASLIFRPYRNERFTAEDVMSGGRSYPGAAWLIAF